LVPEGFRVAEQFPGLLGEDALSSVMVNEIPGPVEKVRAGMTERALAARGSQLLRSEPVTVAGREGLLVHVLEEVAPGAELRRWILVFGRADASVVISASTPRVFADRLGETLRDTLLSAEWDPDRVIGPYEGLGFTVAEAGTLKISDRLPSMISFTRGGHRGALAPDEPLFLAGTSVAPDAVTDLEDFARRQLRATGELRDFELLSESSLELGGLPAHELVAAATDRKSGTPLRVYQTLVVDGRRYFLLQGLVGAAGAEEFVPQFREIAHSFHRTR
jgi:hypothetical protein